MYFKVKFARVLFMKGSRIKILRNGPNICTFATLGRHVCLTSGKKYIAFCWILKLSMLQIKEKERGFYPFSDFMTFCHLFMNFVRTAHIWTTAIRQVYTLRSIVDRKRKSQHIHTFRFTLVHSFVWVLFILLSSSR